MSDNEERKPTFHVGPNDAAIVFGESGADLIAPAGVDDSTTIEEGSNLWFANGIMLLLSDEDGADVLNDMIVEAYENLFSDEESDDEDEDESDVD